MLKISLKLEKEEKSKNFEFEISDEVLRNMSLFTNKNYAYEIAQYIKISTDEINNFMKTIL
jgi:hypothetical protein